MSESNVALVDEDRQGEIIPIDGVIYRPIMKSEWIKPPADDARPARVLLLGRDKCQEDVFLTVLQNWPVGNNLILTGTRKFGAIHVAVRDWLQRIKDLKA